MRESKIPTRMGGSQLNEQGRVIYSPVVKRANQKHARYIQNRYKKMPLTLSREGRGGVGDVEIGRNHATRECKWMSRGLNPCPPVFVLLVCVCLLTQGEGLQRQR